MLDVLLPTDGQYYVEVDTFAFSIPEIGSILPDLDVESFCAGSLSAACTDSDLGGYELFLYSVQGVEPAFGSGDVLIGGPGSDKLIGSSGDDLFFSDALDTIIDDTGLVSQFENTAPVLIPVGNQVVNPGGLLELTVAATDEDSDPLEIRIEPVDGFVFPAGATFDPDTGLFKWTAPMETTVSSFAVQFVATDQFGNSDTETVEILVTIVEIEGAPQSVLEGDEVTLNSTVISVGAGIPPTFQWNVEKNGMPFPTGTATDVPTFNFTPDDNGIYVVSLNLFVGGEFLGADSVTIEATNVAPAATIDDAPLTSPEGAPILLTSTVDDPGSADTFDYVWSVTKNDALFTPDTPTDGADFEFTPDENASYVVSLTVTDDDGESAPSIMKTITVANVNPSVNVGTDLMGDEGVAVGFTGTFFDPGTLDTHTIQWSFGDGTTETGTLTPNHTFADNGTFTVTLTVTDDEGGVGTDSLFVTVINVAPTVDAGLDATVGEGQTISLAPSTFNDQGTLDTHTATVNWGDGTLTVVGIVTESPFGPPGSTAGADGTVAGSHVFADNGTYTVTVTVTDDDFATASDTFRVTVVGVAPAITVNRTTQTVQYSDPVADVIITATDVPADVMNATTSWSTDGVTFVAGLPDALTIAGGLSLNGAPDQVGTATWTLTGIADLDPAQTYTIRVSVSDEDGISSYIDTIINVNQEDARVTYSGALFVSTPSINDSTAVVTLRATIQDITAVAGDFGFDTH